jgi:hypothetical protein
MKIGEAKIGSPIVVEARNIELTTSEFMELAKFMSVEDQLKNVYERLGRSEAEILNLKTLLSKKGVSV